MMKDGSVSVVNDETLAYGDRAGMNNRVHNP